MVMDGYFLCCYPVYRAEQQSGAQEPSAEPAGDGGDGGDDLDASWLGKEWKGWKLFMLHSHKGLRLRLSSVSGQIRITLH